MRFVLSSLYGAAVSGTVDATYLAAWLTFGDPAHPVRTTGNLSLTATPAGSVSVDVIAISHHNVKQAATVGIGALGTIPTAAPQRDGIPHNWVRVLAEAADVSSVALSISGNTDPIVVGDLVAGLSVEFPDFLAGRTYKPRAPFPWEGEYALLAPYDPGISAQRRVRGTVILDDAEFAALEDLHVGQRNGSRPVLWIGNDAVNDAWLGLFEFEEAHDEGWHFVTLEIVEIPRVRWP